MGAPSAYVELQNVAFPPRPITFHLPHAIYCAQMGECGCSHHLSGALRLDRKKRARVIESRRHRLPAAVTVWARGTEGSVSRPLPRAVLEVPEVARAISRHELQAVDVVASSVTGAPAPAPAPAPADAPADGNPEEGG
jgi:hypothetical protein